MKAYRATFPLAAMCRVLGLSPSGYYGWLTRPPSYRARRDIELQGKILLIWRQRGDLWLPSDPAQTKRRRFPSTAGVIRSCHRLLAVVFASSTNYRRHGVCAYIAAWDVHRARLFGEVVGKISIVALLDRYDEEGIPGLEDRALARPAAKPDHARARGRGRAPYA